MTDAELVEAALAGRAEAYGELMDRHQVAVTRVCRRLVGSRVESDGVAHDALVDGYLGLSGLRDPERFGAWIRTIALNRCRRWLREQARLSPLTERMADEMPEPASAEPRSGYVAHAMFRLRHDQRLMLVLHYWERLPYADIAEFLGVPIGTVMSRLSRARAGLRKVMEMHADAMEPGAAVDIRRDVDAEIRVMLAMVEKDRDLRGRLAVLLRRSPRRLEDLVGACDDSSARDVALLLPRLGADVMDRLLGWAWGRDGALRDGSMRVLRALAGVPAHVAEGAPTSRLASRGLYRLVDRALSLAPDAGAAAALMLELLDHTARDDRAALLLANAAYVCGDAGLSYAVYRLRERPDAASVFRAGDTLHVACRYGTRFGEALLPSLDGAGEFATSAAVGCAEALGRAIGLWADLGCLDDAELLADARRRRKWAAPVRRDRDPAVIEQLAEALERFVAGDDGELRERAVRTLGLLPCTKGLEALTRAADHPDKRTALAASRALARRASLTDARRAAPGSERHARRSGSGFHMADLVRDGATPPTFISLEAALGALPADREYDEPEITRIIASASYDYSSVRRYLVEEGILERPGGLYRLTDLGRTTWRVERRIAEGARR